MSNQGWLPVRPRRGALAASAFDPPESGGGGSPVTPPAATTEALPDTDTPTAKTFSAFTDAGGLIDNYLSEIVDIEGTTTASGSGLGPYTYSGAGPGSAFMHLLHARDADDNILATAAHGVDIMPSPPEGPYDWVSPVAFDFAAATPAGPWTTGTNAVSGAAASSVNVTTVRAGTTNGQVEVTADGLETGATTGTGTINSAVGLRAYLSANDAYFTAGPGVVVVQACYKLAALAGSGTYWVVGVSNKTSQAQAFCGVACNYSAGNVVVTTYYDFVSNTTLYSGAIPTDFRVTVYIYQGRTSRVKFEAGVSTIETDPPTSGLSFTGQPVLAANTAQFFGDTGGADFNWLTSVRSNGHNAEATLTDLKVWRLEVVP